MGLCMGQRHCCGCPTSNPNTLLQCQVEDNLKVSQPTSVLGLDQSTARGWEASRVGRGALKRKRGRVQVEVATLLPGGQESLWEVRRHAGIQRLQTENQDLILPWGRAALAHLPSPEESGHDLTQL